MNKLYKICCLLGIGLLVQGCLMTQSVQRMDTRENIHYHPTEIYLLKNNKIFVKFTPSNKNRGPYYSLWDRSKNIIDSYGVLEDSKYYTYGDSLKTVKIPLSEDTSRSRSSTPFPKCLIKVTKYYDLDAKLYLNEKPYASASDGVPFVFGDVSKLCDDVDLLAVYDPASSG